jgi:regulator of sigma E protease
MQFFLAFLAIVVLIVVHEWGHYFVARLCKMRVEKFSIFFGPAIASIKGKHTTFQIGVLPLGGFVQITGMNPMEDHDPNDPHIYPNRPAWQRFLTILAGPAMNYVAAVLILFGIFAYWGIPHPTEQQRVTEVRAGKPAATAGVQAGDVLVMVNGEHVSPANPATAIMDRSGGKPVPVVFLRDGKPITLTLTPTLDGGHYIIGVALLQVEEYRRESLLAVARYSITWPAVRTADILGSLYDVVRGRQKLDVSGPPQIVYQLGKHIKDSPRDALGIIASLSVFLGLFNLLPIPALDGGRLAFLSYEIVSRRRVNQKVEAGVHMVGMVVLLGLMVLVMFKDVRQFFVHGG